MRKQWVMYMVIFAFSFVGCSSPHNVKKAPTVPKSVKQLIPATIDFGEFWTGTIRIKTESKPSLKNKSEVRFSSEWTLGESAGIVYPKTFTLSKSGEEVKMDSLWDNGGTVPAGTYDIFVDIDGMPKTGTIKNLNLKKGVSYEVYLLFTAAKIDIPLQTDGDEILVYPAGIYSKYNSLGRLDNIPKEIAINSVSSYTENNPIYWLIPARIPLDVLRTTSSGETNWFTNYIATPESFVKSLP